MIYNSHHYACCYLFLCSCTYRFKEGIFPILTYLFSICTSHKPLLELSLGLNEELLQDTTKYLEVLGKLRPEKLTLLGLASIKDEPGNYLINNCDPALFLPFTKLKVKLKKKNKMQTSRLDNTLIHDPLSNRRS